VSNWLVTKARAIKVDGANARVIEINFANIREALIMLSETLDPSDARPMILPYTDPQNVQAILIHRSFA